MRLRKGYYDRSRSQMPKLRECPFIDQRSCPENADPVTEELDLTQDVGGQKDRLAPHACFVYCRAECRLHQWVEARGGLVENQNIGTGSKGGDQLDLLAVTL